MTPLGFDEGFHCNVILVGVAAYVMSPTIPGAVIEQYAQVN